MTRPGELPLRSRTAAGYLRSQIKGQVVGLSGDLHRTSSAAHLAQIPDFSGDEHGEQVQ